MEIDPKKVQEARETLEAVRQNGKGDRGLYGAVGNVAHVCLFLIDWFVDLDARLSALEADRSTREAFDGRGNRRS